MEEERTRLQLGQLREEVEKGRRETAAVRSQADSVSQKSYKTQSYIRSLMREETNLNETLSRVEDENGKLDASISELDTAVSVNQG
jgi:predicted nuclease with TOPRIM domain